MSMDKAKGKPRLRNMKKSISPEAILEQIKTRKPPSMLARIREAKTIKELNALEDEYEKFHFVSTKSKKRIEKAFVLRRKDVHNDETE